MKIINIFLFFIFIYTQYSIFFNKENYKSYIDINKEIKKEICILKKIKYDNFILKKEINDLLNNNKDIIESISRNELLMIKSGEIFYRLIYE